MPTPAAIWEDGKLKLSSNGTSIAGVSQEVTTASPDVRHGVRIKVSRGSVFIKIGTTDGAADIMPERRLRTGYHHHGFIPTETTFFIRIYTTANAHRYVDFVKIAEEGDVTVEAPWTENDDNNIHKLRTTQRNDVIYTADGEGPLHRIERWGATSWSVVEMRPDDGPFQSPNINSNITITPSVRSGVGTLTSNRPLFQEGHVGSLWRIIQNGQNGSGTLSGQDQFSSNIKVTGITAGRTFQIVITGTFTATVHLQRSVGNEDNWTDVSSYTSAQNFSFSDGFDNQIIYYRLGIKSGNYTSGTATVNLIYSGGATTGIARVTDYTDEDEVEMEVIQPFAQASASSEWSEGSWSDVRGWPRAVAIAEGRLFVTSGDLFWASASDAYESFKTGDLASDAIARSVATGETNTTLWLLNLARVLFGTSGSEVTVRSNNFDEPITNTNVTVKDSSTYGSADVAAIKIDRQGAFVGRDGIRLYHFAYDVQIQDYKTSHLSRLHRNIGRPGGIKQLAIQRSPDTRIWARRDDGQMLPTLYDPGEGIAAFARMITGSDDDGIESAIVLPAANEDQVHMIVRRTINGSERRYYEVLDPFYREDGASCNYLDSFLRYEGAAASIITGLDHLIGETVRVWVGLEDGSGARHADCVVNEDGEIELEYEVTSACIGLLYTGRYKSTKLAFAPQKGTPLNNNARAHHIGFLLMDSVRGAIHFGSDFGDYPTMDQLPDRDEDSLYDLAPGLWTGETEKHPVPGDRWLKDPRLCIKVEAPYPVTIQGLILGMSKHA